MHVFLFLFHTMFIIICQDVYCDCNCIREMTWWKFRLNVFNYSNLSVEQHAVFGKLSHHVVTTHDHQLMIINEHMGICQQPLTSNTQWVKVYFIQHIQRKKFILIEMKERTQRKKWFVIERKDRCNLVLFCQNGEWNILFGIGNNASIIIIHWDIFYFIFYWIELLHDNIYFVIILSNI